MERGANGLILAGLQFAERLQDQVERGLERFRQQRPSGGALLHSGVGDVAEDAGLDRRARHLLQEPKGQADLASRGELDGGLLAPGNVIAGKSDKVFQHGERPLRGWPWVRSCCARPSVTVSNSSRLAGVGSAP